MGLKENIKKARLSNNLTLEEVAQKIGISRSTLHKYESGAIPNIPVDKIEKLATALSTTPQELIGWIGFVQLKKQAEEDLVTDKVNLFTNIGYSLCKIEQDKYELSKEDMTITISEADIDNLFFNVLDYASYNIDKYFNEKVKIQEGS